jgi:hypothetical protein
VRYLSPAVAGWSFGGPVAGDGFSDGPDAGGTIVPVGYGHTSVAGTQTVTLVGKSKPELITVGMPGRWLANVTFMRRPP